VSKGSDHVRTKITLQSYDDEKTTLSLGRVRPSRPSMLRCRGEVEPTTKFWNKQLARELFAEMIGTGMIVQSGTGAIMSSIFCDALVGLYQIASVWIIAVTLAIATTGSISGAHLNPAVSISFALLRPSCFAWQKLLLFCVAQLTGATLASWVNLMLYGNKIREFEAANRIVRGAANSIASAKAFGEYFE
jgi:glycerol uptake facilitator-like aquaporin